MSLTPLPPELVKAPATLVFLGVTILLRFQTQLTKIGTDFTKTLQQDIQQVESK